MMTLIPLFKALHLIGMVAWFAGLFYLVRVFVYHRESFEKNEPERSILIKQFNTMEWRVYRIICNPGMMITWTFGVITIISYGMEWFGQNGWLHVKILLIVLLTVYHIYCKLIIKRLEKEARVMSSERLRLFNEVPTLILVTTIILAIYKNGINYGTAGLSIILFAAILVIFTKIYKKQREKSQQ